MRLSNGRPLSGQSAVLSTRPLALMARLGTALGLGLLCMASAHAQIAVSDAWARATLPAQGATGVFMTIKSATPAKLVGVQTPVAGVAEVHEMTMNGDTMSMRAMPALELPAGQAVELKPGSYHIMLMDLKKKPLKAGDKVPLTLKVQAPDGKISTSEVMADVRAMGAAPASGMDHSHMHH